MQMFLNSNKLLFAYQLDSSKSITEQVGHVLSDEMFQGYSFTVKGEYRFAIAVLAEKGGHFLLLTLDTVSSLLLELELKGIRWWDDNTQVDVPDKIYECSVSDFIILSLLEFKDKDKVTIKRLDKPQHTWGYNFRSVLRLTDGEKNIDGILYEWEKW